MNEKLHVKMFTYIHLYLYVYYIRYNHLIFMTDRLHTSTEQMIVVHVIKVPEIFCPTNVKDFTNQFKHPERI